MSTPVDRIRPDGLAALVVGTDEIAVVDAREQGAFSASHLLHASCVPLSRLELMLDHMVPRRSTPLVWCDEGGGEADRAAARASALGWTDVSVLDGGTPAWAVAGLELYSGVNVPSKMFG